MSSFSGSGAMSGAAGAGLLGGAVLGPFGLLAGGAAGGYGQQMGNQLGGHNNRFGDQWAGFANKAAPYIQGAGSGAASGAATGAAFGPYGALVGAGLGAAGGAASTYGQQQNQKAVNAQYGQQATNNSNMANAMATSQFGPGSAAAASGSKAYQSTMSGAGQANFQLNQQSQMQYMQALQQLAQLYQMMHTAPSGGNPFGSGGTWGGNGQPENGMYNYNTNYAGT